MKVGDIINPAGYDRVAKAGYDHGDIVVLTNNSDHFIVVEAESEHYGLDGEVKVRGIVSYDDADGRPTIAAYRMALKTMVEIAIAESSSLMFGE